MRQPVDRRSLAECVEKLHGTHAGRGAITIEATENPLYTQVVVLDSGPGIRRQELPYVFQRFYRGKEASAGSVGIGLAMARSFLEGQNADITALPGPGGHFVLRFYKQATV